MTWLNIAARLSGMLVVLPIILNRFAPADISLYYLFASLVSLQLMTASGFVPTLARFYSFVLNGARLSDLLQGRHGKTQEKFNGETICFETLANLRFSMARGYRWLAIITTPVCLIAGSVALEQPISASQSANSAWVAWAVICLVNPFVLLSTQYSALLQGANRVALDQRWSAIFVLLGSLSGVIVVSCGGGLLELVISNQIWQVVGYLRLRWLASKVFREIVGENSQVRAVADVDYWRAVWPASWRSLLGVVSSNGISTSVGLVFAQFLDSKPLAELLLALRIITLIAEISRAPFYSRIPRFNALRAKGELAALGTESQRSMRSAYVCFIVGVFLTPAVAAVALPLIGSQISFPDTGFWFLLSAAYLIERIGAMHVQLYSTTNHIIWHWLNGITGVIWIGLMLVLTSSYGKYAYPLSMLAAYLACYTSVGSFYSLRSIGANFWKYERTGAIPAMGIYCALAMVVWHSLNSQ